MTPTELLRIQVYACVTMRAPLEPNYAPVAYQRYIERRIQILWGA